MLRQRKSLLSVVAIPCGGGRGGKGGDIERVILRN